VAKYAGLELSVPPEAKGESQTGKIPVLETDQGCIFTNVAIARYLSRLRRDVGLYGQNLIEGGMIDSWVEFCTHELEIPLSTWIFPLKGIFPEVPEATAQAKIGVKRALDVLNNHLLHNTYMVGHQVTLADVSIVCALADAMTIAFDKQFLEPLPNLMRWYGLVSSQPEFVGVLGKAQPFAGKAAPGMPAKKGEDKKGSPTAQPKKDAKKEENKEKQPKPEPKKKEAAPKKEKGDKGDKGEKEEAPKTKEELEADRKKQMKTAIKEGGKRGVEIEGAADMGGLQFFCTSVDAPQGDIEMLEKCLEAMNAKSDPTEEERKGGSGAIGKMIFSAGAEQLAVAAYVPDAPLKDLQGNAATLVAEDWLKTVLANFGGYVISTSKTVCIGAVKADGDKNIFPLKIREPMILEANNFLRKKNLFPEDNDDSDDEMVFGDDDFPS